MIERLKVKDIMFKPTIVGNNADSLSEILSKMKRSGFYDLPVVDNNKLIGIISYNLLTKRRQIPVTASVSHLMIKSPSLTPQDPLLKLAELFISTGLSCLPVTIGDEFQGIVTIFDLIKILRAMPEFKDLPITTVMKPDPTCINGDEPLAKARRLMEELNESVLPVVDKNKQFIGIINIDTIATLAFTDVKKKGKLVIGDRYPLEIRVDSVMISNNLPVVDATATLQTVIDLMATQNFSVVIVTSENIPIGSLSQLDILELIASTSKREGVYIQITGLTETDPDLYDTLYRLIQKSMKRINKIVRPELLTFHVSSLRETGLIARYEIRAKLITAKHTFYSRAGDWDLLRAFATTLNHLEQRIRRNIKLAKEMRIRTQPVAIVTTTATQ